MPIDSAAPDASARILELMHSHHRISVELGCGPFKTKGRIGIDRLPLPGVDIIADIENGLPFFPDHSIDEIHSESFFEHIENLETLIREIVRVLKPEGRNHLFVPHFSNPTYYSDYTHRRFFGLYTFYYFSAHQEKLIRKVPFYYTDIRIRVIHQRLRFSSSFRGMRLFKKFFEKFINLNVALQEFYEENLCTIVPCYGMDIVFEPDDGRRMMGPGAVVSGDLID